VGFYQEAAAVLHELPFKVPHMPLTLNAKQLTGEHAYELTFVDPVANRRRYFAVPPELAGVLPADDFRHRFFRSPPSRAQTRKSIQIAVPQLPLIPSLSSQHRAGRRAARTGSRLPKDTMA